jgi:hypothetical protein
MPVGTLLLSAERIAEAKAEAQDLLEYSIYTLCVLLGVDIALIEGSYDIPFALTDANATDYNNHASLKQQVDALTKLNEV